MHTYTSTVNFWQWSCHEKDVILWVHPFSEIFSLQETNTYHCNSKLEEIWVYTKPGPNGPVHPNGPKIYSTVSQWGRQILFALWILGFSFYHFPCKFSALLSLSFSLDFIFASTALENSFYNKQDCLNKPNFLGTIWVNGMIWDQVWDLT